MFVRGSGWRGFGVAWSALGACVVLAACGGGQPSAVGSAAPSVSGGPAAVTSSVPVASASPSVVREPVAVESAGWPELSPELAQARLDAWMMPQPPAPEGMGEDSLDGAAKTALYFCQLGPYVMATGDTETWDDLYNTEQCELGKRLSEKARLLHENGGWMDHWEPECSIGEENFQAGSAESAIEVKIRSVSGGSVVHTDSGLQQRESPPGNEELSFRFDYQDGSWVISECIPSRSGQ